MPVRAASWITGQGVSSRSSHSAATGRTTSAAKPWTHFLSVCWSSVRSSVKPATGCSSGGGYRR